MQHPPLDKIDIYPSRKTFSTVFFNRGCFRISQHISLIDAWSNALPISTFFIASSASPRRFSISSTAFWSSFLANISRIVNHISHTSLTSAGTSSLILSPIVCHLFRRYLSPISSLASDLLQYINFTCIIIISSNTIASRTSHPHPIFTSSNAMISTLPPPPPPPIPTFADPFLCKARSGPSTLLIQTTA